MNRTLKIKDKWIILAVTALLMGALYMAGATGLRQRYALMAEMRADLHTAPVAEASR